MTHIIHAYQDDGASQCGQAMHDADAAISHLIELRNCPTTRDDMMNEEAELWRLKSNLEWLLTSILLDKAKGEKLQAAE
jgi:hypothetical protein